MKIIEDHIEEIKVLCHQQRVKVLYVFGSVLTEAFNESSDIDLMVEFEKVDPIDYLDHYYGLKFDFQNGVKTKRAVERNIEIIGEAMSRTLKMVPDIEISDSRKIVDTTRYL